MNLAHPLLSSVLCRLVIGAVLLAVGRGAVPVDWVPYLILTAGAADVVILWWLIETVKELCSGAPKSPPVDSGKPLEPPGPVQPPSPPVQPPAKPPVASGRGDAGFAACMPYTRKEEGGNDKAGANGPNDPRTSRGITQPEWDTWRNTHPGLPADVWQAPEDQVSAIYKTKYWDAMNCGALPPGIDLVVFDYGVHSGIGRAPKVLQTILHVDIDGEIGPNTVAAANNSDHIATINALCDQRLSFLQSLSIWSQDKNDFTRRVANMRAAGIKMASGQVTSAPTPPPSPASSVSGAAIIAIVTSLDGQHWTAGNNPTINGWIEEIAAKWPDRAAYARTLENHGYFAWCGLTCAYVMTKAGFKPPAEFYAAIDWLNFGTKVDTPQPGDVLVYQWHGGSDAGGHHVSIYDHETDGDYYASHGGNQSHAVNITQFPMNSCIGIRRPS